MKTFSQWAEENKLELPELDEGRRVSMKPQYPDACGRNQLPPAAFAPYSATAFLDLENAKKTKSVKG